MKNLRLVGDNEAVERRVVENKEHAKATVREFRERQAEAPQYPPAHPHDEAVAIARVREIKAGIDLPTPKLDQRDGAVFWIAVNGTRRIPTMTGLLKRLHQPRPWWRRAFEAMTGR